jgi:hypothetical protein
MKRCRICKKSYDQHFQQVAIVELDFTETVYEFIDKEFHFHEPMSEAEEAQYLLERYEV